MGAPRSVTGAGELDRRRVLTGLGLAAAGAVAGSMAGAATALAGPGISPFDLHFRIAHQFRPFALIAPRFVQFDTAVPSGWQPAVAAGARPTAAGLLFPAGRAADLVVRTGISPRAPFASVLVEVAQLDQGGVLAGLSGSNGDAVFARYDAASATASIEVTVRGVRTVVDSVRAELRAPFRLGFVVNENAVTVLADSTNTGTGWVPLVSERDAVAARIDLRRPAVLGQLSYSFGASGAGAVTLGRVQAGYFGQAGLRDLHVVQTTDGTAYVRGGKLYLTATNAGLGFFQQAHWGVWTLDLADPTRLEQVAQLFFARDGVVLGDHAGQIVHDERRGEFIVAMSSWGDFAFNGVHIRHVTTKANVLSGVHVLATQRLGLPTSVSSWDPSLTRIDGRWHVAFVESPSQTPFDFHPALAVGPRGAAYHERLELRGADTAVHQTEGTVLQRIGDSWYVLASDGDARQYRVYDLGLRLLGTLDAPYKTNIPHPQVVPVRSGGRAGWLLLTFDGTQYAEPVLGYGGHGDVIVMRA